MFILDTSAIIEIMRKTEKGLKIMKKIAKEEIYISVFSVYELLMGVKKGEDNVVEMIRMIPIISFEKEDAVKSFEIQKSLEKRGKLINLVDVFIASIALRSGYHFVSCDKDFGEINGLSVTLY